MRNVLFVFMLFMLCMCFAPGLATVKAESTAVQINSPQEFLNMLPTGNYELACNIDLAQIKTFAGFEEFCGTLNGNGFKIKNLSLNLAGNNFSLFGNVKNAHIENLIIENLSIISTGEINIFANTIKTSTIKNIEIKNAFINADTTSMFSGKVLNSSIKNLAISGEFYGRLNANIFCEEFFESTFENCFFKTSSKIYDFNLKSVLDISSATEILQTLPSIYTATKNNFGEIEASCTTALSFGFSEYNDVLLQINAIACRLEEAAAALENFLNISLPENFLAAPLGEEILLYQTAKSFYANFENKQQFNQKEEELAEILNLKTEFETICTSEITPKEKILRLENMLTSLNEEDSQIVLALIKSLRNETENSGQQPVAPPQTEEPASPQLPEAEQEPQPNPPDETDPLNPTPEPEPQLPEEKEQEQQPNNEDQISPPQTNNEPAGNTLNNSTANYSNSKNKMSLRETTIIAVTFILIFLFGIDFKKKSA